MKKLAWILYLPLFPFVWVEHKFNQLRDRLTASLEQDL